MSAPDVVVVGAGFAGLSAACALAEAGVRVLVLDARPQLGGRATAFRDRETGELVDNGQHVMFGCYRETFRFLRRVGAEAHVRVQQTLEIPFLDVTGRRSVLRCPRLPAPFHLLGAVLAWDAMPWRDRLSVLRLAAPLNAARRELLRTASIAVEDGDPTVSEWLRRHGQGARLREWLWEPLAVAALNQPPEEASAAPFVRVLADMFGPDVRAAALVLPTKPLHLVYAEPARSFIEARGGEVRSSALARVRMADGRVDGVELRGHRIDARRVIAAVPWFGLRSLLATVPPELNGLVSGADAMTSMPIVTVNLWYDRQVMQDAFVGLPGRAMQWVFDKRVAFGESASHLSLVSSGAAALVGETGAELTARAAAEVEAAIPGARGARLVRATVICEKQATFSLAPGQPARPVTRTAVDGLFLAGDWIDTGLPGTIESAVVSGHRAAAMVIGE
ncbi:MAG: hydroxysqualene dehydroxylase HpnE [Acidobacteria bacterium]|nr:hydroxysqualene dehydroxylase HpnE [Acidobacteriota bacterium]